VGAAGGQPAAPNQATLQHAAALDAASASICNQQARPGMEPPVPDLATNDDLRESLNCQLIKVAAMIAIASVLVIAALK
jgi:hypothetical protein